MKLEFSDDRTSFANVFTTKGEKIVAFLYTATKKLSLSRQAFLYK